MDSATYAEKAVEIRARRQRLETVEVTKRALDPQDDKMFIKGFDSLAWGHHEIANNPLSKEWIEKISNATKDSDEKELQALEKVAQKKSRRGKKSKTKKGFN